MSQGEISTVGWSSVMASPNRSASVVQLQRFVVCFAVVCGLVCAFSFLQGNLLAPVFGVLNVLFVAWALRLAWCASDQSDRVVWQDGQVWVELQRSGRVSRLSFHPFWARLERRSAAREGDPQQLWLGSHGRFVELGRFLGAERRQQFAQDVERLLAAARHG